MNIIVAQAELADRMMSEAEVQGVGLFYFEENGKEGLRKFEEKAGGFFKKYGLHLSHILDSQAVMAAIGADDIPQPDEIQFLSVDTQANLGELFSDQGFLDLVPQRDASTKRLTFFLGSKIY